MQESKKDKRGRELQKTQEKSHRQIETREYYQTGYLRCLDGKKEWNGLKSIA